MEPAEEKSSDWKKVERKPKEKSKNPADSAAGSRIDGHTKAAPSQPRQIVGLDPKAEAARRRAEKEKRFNTGRKVAALPEALTKRSDEPNHSSSDDEASDSGDRSPTSAAGGDRAKNDGKESAKGANNAKDAAKKHSAALQAALKKIDTKALVEEVNKAKSAQGNDKWIRLIVERLNEKLAHIPSDPNFYSEHGFTWGYPLSMAPSALVSALDGLLASSPANFLQAYLDWIVTDACRNNIPNRRSYHGSQLVIQYLLKKFPNLVTEKNLTQRVEEIRSVQSRKEEMLMIMWSYGQAGLTSFSDGLQVWYKLMFPLINSRAYSGFGLAYLEQLFKNHKSHDYSKTNTQQMFLNVFDGFFGTNSSNFTKQHKKKIAELYRIFHEELFQKDLKKSSKEYFPQFLMRLGMQQPEEYQHAACDNLLQCLKTERGNLAFWLEKYPSSMRDTQILLNYIADTDDEDSRRLRRDKHFVRFLDDLEQYQPNKKAAASTTFKQDAGTVKTAVDKIRAKKRQEDGRKRRRRYFFLLVVLAAAVCGEIAYHGTKKSYAVHSYKVSKPYVVRAWNAAQPVVAHTWSTAVKPFLLWSWAQSIQLAQLLLAAALHVWDVVEKQLPVVYDFLMGLGVYLEVLWKELARLTYQAAHKVDQLLVGMPTVSEMLGKCAPAAEWVREQAHSVWLSVQPRWEQAWEQVWSWTVKSKKA
ncbi:transmembrane protein 214-like [Paramacrobiotus metropolitanus]|uniref:transmembrane protein 214-like n=1 Tax=Paramacrobiotus metropolitanus TaxID=2943436 RepID=UPI002446483F|nr:transmembrane protein 214-like [Paramacrobiotus metropolitanus]